MRVSEVCSAHSRACAALSQAANNRDDNGDPGCLCIDAFRVRIEQVPGLWAAFSPRVCEPGVKYCAAGEPIWADVSSRDCLRL